MSKFSIVVLLFTTFIICTTAVGSSSSCRFSLNYQCDDFKDKYPNIINEYMAQVMTWEGRFAQPGIGYDAATGYTYDGHPLEYETGELYGEPHLFSAPSKESIHIGILALAVGGDELALSFTGGMEKTIEVLELKMKGYMAFNETYPGFGCFTPWVDFDSTTGTFNPLESWSTPYYKVPGLDNGEWFWSLYAVAFALEELASSTAATTTSTSTTTVSSSTAIRYANLAAQYRAFVDCQKANAKMMFYRGDGVVSATIYILDGSVAPFPENYIVADGDVLNDPYEGETMTQMLYLFSEWENEVERYKLWTAKRELFQAVNYSIPMEKLSVEERKAMEVASAHGDNDYDGAGGVITVQRGWWFSTHEQWKLMLLPYLSDDLPLVQKVFSNCEKARTWDAYVNALPGLLASVNDVTNGSQTIPDYASPCGVGELSFEQVHRRDLMTPYGSFALFLVNPPAGLCWYNNMLSGPRMQSKYGSTEAINANGTEISPVTTWDSKITTVLAMLGGVSNITARALQTEPDALHGSAYARFVSVVGREYTRVFGSEEQVLGGDIAFKTPGVAVPTGALSDWVLDC